MLKYTKDEINFHGFLSAVRKMRGKSTTVLARGLYSRTMMSRIEKGERLPKKLERDRIVARLGISGEGYEDYLSREEYGEWVLRQDILKSIEDKEVAKLEELLAEFALIKDPEKVELQFLETMRFMLLKIKGAAEDELRKMIDRAVAYTIPEIDEGFPKKLLLADQEINLLIEYVNLHNCGETLEECREWKIARYKDISMYIKESCIDDIGRAKVYPKLVYFICQEYAKENTAAEENRECLAMCNDAIELLRNTRKMYYMVELLELRQELIARIIEETAEPPSTDLEEFGELASTSKAWEKLLKELYTEYDVYPYMTNFCYLYLETESHCVNDVIRLRRRMLRITQRELAGDVCDEKTVRRIEKMKISPQMYDIRGLFGRLGMCPEYVRANVITSDPEVMALHRQLNKHINEREYEAWKECLNKLENSLCMDIVQNKQIVMTSRNWLELCTHKKSTEEYIASLKEILEYTIPIDKAFKYKEWYLTDAELTSLHAIAVNIDVHEKNPYLLKLIEYCEAEIHNGSVSIRMRANEFIITSVANSLGSMGYYEKSNQFSETILKCSLMNRRMSTLAKNIYNRLWNELQVSAISSKTRDDEYDNKVLHRCILLCDIAKMKQFKKFFESKLKD